MQQEYQEGYAKAFQTIPANQDAQEVVEDPALLTIIESYNEAPYVTVWLDTMFGQNVGNALNKGVVDLFAGRARRGHRHRSERRRSTGIAADHDEPAGGAPL